jgi:carboxyl-terminal processing protease
VVIGDTSFVSATDVRTTAMNWRRSPSWLASWLLCGVIAGCATSPTSRSDLLGESYQLIDQFYLKPVKTSTVGEASLAALTELDHDIAIDVVGSSLVLTRQERLLGRYRLPTTYDWHAWGDTAARATTAAAAASPAIAQLSDDELDRILIDGAITALDRYSLYLPPEEARQSPIVEDTPVEPAQSRRGDGAFTPSPAAISSGARPLSRPSVQFRMDGAVAVMRILRFTTRTGALVRHWLAQAHAAAKLRGVILDLRDDPGGQIAAAADVADIFLAQGTVVALEGRNPRDRRVFSATSDGSIYEAIPLAVLVSGRSISAAEVLAAALQDNSRAVVIGTSTFGKGTAQRIVPLANGGELWVTSSYMRAPAGYLLHHHGVVPDVCTRPATGDRAASLERLGLLMTRSRASLSDAEWAELRRLCPPSPIRLGVDSELILAKQLLRRQASLPR